MKGIVFTEYIEFVEDSFGFEIAQEMIDSAELTSNAVFTAVGTYDVSEMTKMLDQLSKLTKISISELLKSYGKHLFSRFASFYPHFFPKGIDIFSFISQVDKYIHVEVRKLYPDAELPSIETIVKKDDYIEIVYTSSRKLGDFAHGLLLGACNHFNEDIEIRKEILISDGSKVKFSMQRK